MRAMVALIACTCLVTAARGQDSAALRRSAGQADNPQPSPQQIQHERLTILTQERTKLAMALQDATQASSAAATADEKAESALRVQRIEGDLRALANEILLVAKTPPAPLRNTGLTTRVSRPEPVAQAPAIPSRTLKAEGAFEDWDVFKNFGKQGTTP